MSNFEIAGPRKLSYQKCYVDDFDERLACYHVSFEHGWKASRWVRPDQLRIAPSSPPASWRPSLQEKVECEAKTSDDEPWSWFRATVCARSKSRTAYEVRFSGSSQKAIVSIDCLRPKASDRGLPFDVRLIHVRLPEPIEEENVTLYENALDQVARKTGMILIAMVAPNKLKLIGRIISIRKATQLIASIDLSSPMSPTLVVDCLNVTSPTPELMSPTPPLVSNVVYHTKHLGFDRELGRDISVSVNDDPSPSNTVEEESYDPVRDLGEIEVKDFEDDVDGLDDVVGGKTVFKWIRLFDGLVKCEQGKVQRGRQIRAAATDDVTVDSVFAVFDRVAEHPLIRQWICEYGGLNELAESLPRDRLMDLGEDVFAVNVHLLWSVYLGSLQHQGSDVTNVQDNEFSVLEELQETAL